MREPRALCFSFDDVSGVSVAGTSAGSLNKERKGCEGSCMLGSGVCLDKTTKSCNLVVLFHAWLSHLVSER